MASHKADLYGATEPSSQAANPANSKQFMICELLA